MNEKRRDGEEPTLIGESGRSIPVEIQEPQPPNTLSEDDVREARNEALALMSRLQEADGSREMGLLDGITSVGSQAQREAAEHLDLLRTRIGTFINEGGTSEGIANGLRDLRVSLNRINPHELTSPGVANRVIDVLPFVGGRANPVVRALNWVALRYEPVSRQVGEIELKLRDGRELLIRDNVELRKLYEDVEAQQLPIRRNAFLGELLAHHLSQLLEETDDPIKRERLEMALHDVLMRVQGLRTMEEVHLQYFVSIDMSRQNNNRLAQAVEQTLTLTVNVVTVGLAIQTALIRQKRVMEAAQKTREFLGDLVVANAVTINRHTQEVGDLYSNPAIVMEKISEAHDQLVDAMDMASRMRREGIEVAQRNIARLSELSAELEQRVGDALAGPEDPPNAVERGTKKRAIDEEMPNDSQ